MIKHAGPLQHPMSFLQPAYSNGNEHLQRVGWHCAESKIFLCRSGLGPRRTLGHFTVMENILCKVCLQLLLGSSFFVLAHEFLSVDICFITYPIYILYDRCN